MRGLSKITDKILDEARAEAAERLAAADAESAKIYAEYKQKAENEIKVSESDAKEEAAQILARTRSGEQTVRKNIVFKAQGEMIDKAFTSAKDELCELPDDQKIELFSGLMLSALASEFEAEQSRAEIYGVEEDEGVRYYEVMLNARDRDRIGKALMEHFKRKIVGKDLGDIPSRVSLSNESANIEGGLVIKVGDVEINCSIETIVSRLRPSLEARVAKILFPEQTKKG